MKIHNRLLKLNSFLVEEIGVETPKDKRLGNGHNQVVFDHELRQVGAVDEDDAFVRFDF